MIIPLIMGLFTFRDYGESSDESSLYVYSASSLQAYNGLATLNFKPQLEKGDFRYYGPAFLMSANLAAQTIANYFGHINLVDAWHLIYFLSFYFGSVGLYFLVKRWFSSTVALSTTLLFLFQPLLWGHAFINPKDIPFMSFCLLSVLSGLAMQEKLFPTEIQWKVPDLTNFLKQWHSSKKTNRYKIIRLLGLSTVILVFILFGQYWIEKAIALSLEFIDTLPSENLIVKLFTLVAANYQQIPTTSFIAKGIKIVNYVLLALVFTLLGILLFRLRLIFPELLSFLKIKSIKNFSKLTLQYIGNPYVILSGVILGLTISIRILGPFPGIVIALILIYHGKTKAAPAILAYFIIAFAATYLTWPYLWQSPISNFKTSLIYMAEFPWVGKVLFNGNYYTTDQLPLSYVPILFGIQFTEPVILLFLVGVVILASRIWKKSINTELVITSLLWGILPFIAFAIFRPSLYDNIRQLLFITPPLFLIVSLALEEIFLAIKNHIIQFALFALFLLAGIYPIIHLHPYEYTYYNIFVNGLQGSAGKYEADYWVTSFREATEYINQTAPSGSRVIVFGPGDADPAAHFARPDLMVDSLGGTILDPMKDYQYAIISTRNNRETKKFTEWKTIYVIQRDGNIFSIVKQRPE